MKAYFEIPQIEFSKSQYNKEKNEIVLNLNNYRWLDELINDFQKKYRRIIPQIDMISPSGNRVNFSYPRLDGWEIILESKKCNLRLTYK
jgi:hypothetical protein